MWAYSVVAPRRFERVEIACPIERGLLAGQVVLRSIAGGFAAATSVGSPVTGRR
jgi:hypothetical protein